MFLSTKRSKGNMYIYLCCYQVKQHHADNKQLLFGFGRVDKALKKMRDWEVDFEDFPKELIDLGCNQQDLGKWISKIENKNTIIS